MPKILLQFLYILAPSFWRWFLNLKEIYASMQEIFLQHGTLSTLILVTEYKMESFLKEF